MKTDIASFEKVAGLSEVTEVDARGKYLCAVDKRGAVQCWGCPDQHECALWPAPIALPEPAQSVAVGVVGACALLRSGGVQCWGYDSRTSTQAQRAPRWYEKPEPVSHLTAVKQISAMGRGYCALHGTGEVSCWGADAPPARIEGISGASALATGLSFGCAITGPEREVMCWGLTEPALREAQKQPAAVEPVLAPATKVPGLRQVRQLAAGNLFAIAVTDDGAAYHFGVHHEPGLRQFGQPGEREKSARKQLQVDVKPARLSLPARAAGAVVGNNFVCFDLESGTRLCERALATTSPFNIREVWPNVRFEPGGS